MVSKDFNPKRSDISLRYSGSLGVPNLMVYQKASKLPQLSTINASVKHLD